MSSRKNTRVAGRVSECARRLRDAGRRQAFVAPDGLPWGLGISPGADGCLVGRTVAVVASSGLGSALAGVAGLTLGVRVALLGGVRTAMGRGAALMMTLAITRVATEPAAVLSDEGDGRLTVRWLPLGIGVGALAGAYGRGDLDRATPVAERATRTAHAG